MKRNPSPRRTALRITHHTVAIVAGLSLISGGIAGAATVAITAPAQAQEQVTGVQGQPNGAGAQGGGMQGGADTMAFDYTGSYAGTLAADGEAVSSSGETFTATESDQNAALVQNGGSLTLEGALLQKSGDDTDGDRCNFYGVNSILTAAGEDSSATVSNSSLAATSAGSNGIFATDGATVKVSDTSIDTTAGNSRGLDATYGGVITADNVDITTAGDHCAGIATDRGGGTITAIDSSVSTQGSGSPILYSTGDIEVENLTGTASDSQIAGMEGLNTIVIDNSTLASDITGKTASDPIANGIIIYQSTSGDAEATTGNTATFTAEDSTLSSTIQSGSMFYLTNTSATITLKNTVLDFNSSQAALLTASGNDSNNWGQAGSNGASVTVKAVNQTLEGDIVADTISSVSLKLTKGSTWTGSAIIEENESASNTTEAPISITVGKSSSWIVTGDCTVSNLTVKKGATITDNDGQTVSIVANGKTVVEGTGNVTITVTGTYTEA